MSKKTILIMIIMSFFVILLAQGDNTLIVGDSKVYFSIDSTINSKYYTEEYIGYTKTLKSYHFKKNEELGNKIPPSFIKISLPDSLVGDNLKINKGFYATKVDTILLAPFVIKSFELDHWIGNDRTKIYFKNPDNFSHNKQNLFIVSENEKILKEINSFSPEVCKNSEINHRITELIGNYFYENRTELDRQLTYLYPIADSLNDVQLHDEISSKFDFLNFRINKNCYFVVGSFKENNYRKFIASVHLGKEYVNLKIHTNLLNSFMIGNEFYFFCKRSKPNTGWQIFYVYKLEGGELKKVFSDGSFSM